METEFDVTEMLADWAQGDRQALVKLLPAVYADLRARAAAQLRREQGGHSLSPTALLHEAFLRFHASPGPWCQNRLHFFSIASRVMRRVLVDHARTRNAEKRGGPQITLRLDEARDVPAEQEMDHAALDGVLLSLERISPRQCRIVELRYYGGLTIEETAEVMSISTGTVKRDWLQAKAWLYRELRRDTR